MIKIHIILSTLALIVMVIAGGQALLLAMQDYLLRHYQSPCFLKHLPALEIMELSLFRTISLGFILLSLVFISSLIFFHNAFTPALIQKTLLTLLAWAVFAGLLLGRFYLGWRGHVAIRWTLAGVVLLLLIYCGTGYLLNAPP
jgi:ABC-type uncharacterized transport system permease subunit